MKEFVEKELTPTVKKQLDAETLAGLRRILLHARAAAKAEKDKARKAQIQKAIENLKSARKSHSLNRVRNAIEKLGNLFA